MAKTIEVRRHTDNDGDVLSSEGREAALLLGSRLATVDFDLAVSTGAQRATQTIANVLGGGGLSLAGGVLVEAGLRSGDEDRWRAAYHTAGSGHLDDLRAADPEFVSAEVEVLGAALRRVADHLDEDGRALVVGHSPTNEAAIEGLTGQVVEPLGKGEGVLVVQHGTSWEVSAASDPLGG